VYWRGAPSLVKANRLREILAKGGARRPITLRGAARCESEANKHAYTGKQRAAVDPTSPHCRRLYASESGHQTSIGPTSTWPEQERSFSSEAAVWYFSQRANRSW
jgi:hypothetical protein